MTYLTHRELAVQAIGRADGALSRQDDMPTAAQEMQRATVYALLAVGDALVFLEELASLEECVRDAVTALERIDQMAAAAVRVMER